MSECATLYSDWLERITKDTKGKERREHLWSILKRNGFIFFFTDQEAHTDVTHIGKLPINSNTVFTRREKEEKKYGGHVFTIFARDTNVESNVKFKTAKKSSMELWRGYISILGKDRLPPDLDLPLDCIQDMGYVLAGLRRSPREPDARTNLSGDSGISPEIVSSVTVVTKRTSASGGSGGSGGSSSIISEGRGGKRHKFSNNPQGDDIYPSWFIANCSRDKAISIFTAVGKTYGNTLMRESAQSTSQGTYVISYCSKINDNRIPVCDHFKIIRTLAGFKIDVDSPHQDMTNLTDVMMFFIKLNGADRTQSLTTNDLSLLGLKDSAYSTYLPDKADPAPRDSTTAPKREARERKNSEPRPDYDYEPPVASAPRPKTVTVATIQNQMRMYNLDHEHTKEPALSNRHLHHDKIGSHTVAQRQKGGRSGPPPQTRVSMPDPMQFHKSPRAAVSWQDFHVHPPTASPSVQRQETPPPPCESKPVLGYENDRPGFDKVTSGQTMADDSPDLPPPNYKAPAPPPIVPAEKAAPSVPAPGIPAPPPPPPIPPTPPIIDGRDRMMKLRSQSVPNLEFDPKGVKPNSKPLSPLNERVTTSFIQRNPPKSVFAKQGRSFDTGSDRSEAKIIEPGVDASNPGGVGTLSRKFGDAKKHNVNPRHSLQADPPPSLKPQRPASTCGQLYTNDVREEEIYANDLLDESHANEDVGNVYINDTPCVIEPIEYVNTLPGSSNTHNNGASASGVDTSGKPSVGELKKMLNLENLLVSPVLPTAPRVTPPNVRNTRDPLPAIPVESPQDEIYDFVQDDS